MLEKPAATETGDTIPAFQRHSAAKSESTMTLLPRTMWIDPFSGRTVDLLIAE
jgi:hypothetical protein